MIEIMQAWHDNHLDPRRSIMFITWDLSINGEYDGRLDIAPSSDGALEKIFSNAAKSFQASTRVVQPEVCQPDISISIPSLSLMPADKSLPSADFIESFGRTISLVVLNVLRLPSY
jgi:hypothetical protein